jgi:Domain of unknown function (DUF4304)
MATRDDMDAALKAIVVPHARAMGFKGSLPHLRRLRAGAADLVTVQFASAGGRLVIEIGRVCADGIDFHGRHLPLAKLNTSYLRYNHRHRLGAPLSGGDHWFDFANSDVEAVAHAVITELDRTDVWQLVDSWPVLGMTAAE